MEVERKPGQKPATKKRMQTTTRARKPKKAAAAADKPAESLQVEQVDPAKIASTTSTQALVEKPPRRRKTVAAAKPRKSTKLPAAQADASFPVPDEPIPPPPPFVYPRIADDQAINDAGDQLPAPTHPDVDSEASADALARPGRRGRRGRRGRGRRGRGEEDAAVRGLPPKADANRDSRKPRDEEEWDDDWSRQADEAVAVADRDDFDARAIGRSDEDVDYDVQPDDDDDTSLRPARMQTNRVMLINVSGGEECRVAVLQDSRLEELFIERASAQSHVGNIYKGRVTNVEPGIQAVFVDFGLRKNGFLHISDVQPQYFPDHRGEAEEVGRKIPRHLRPPIQKCFRRGQEVIVQVTKEGVGTKGPTLTTYLSIPGRYLVMMPGMNRHGVSRKVEDDVTRRQMRDVMNELNLPPGMGFILRTAGVGRTKRELQRDLNYLIRLWRIVADRVRNMPSPAELYQESDLLTRAVRDVYTPDFEKIIVDDPETAKRAQEFLQIAMPRARTGIELYSAREPLFHRYGVEDEIERINTRHVPLKSGGTLVIDSTEALVAIDVNSGKFRALADAEETAYRINLEAAEEIARQLRLRDLGGLILCDFIDMRADRHKRAVEKALRDALKKHKERARILKMSAFGIIEMTRQRHGPSIKRNIYYDCPHCKGTGLVKMPESVMLDVMRMIQLAAHHDQVQKVTVTVASYVAYQILNVKRAVLSQIESETGKNVVISGNIAFTSDQVECVCEDATGRSVELPMSTSNSLAKPNPDRGGD